jgi:hypothetical protein
MSRRSILHMGLTVTLLVALVVTMIGIASNTASASTFSIGDTVEVYNTGGSGLLVLDAPCGNRIGGKFDGARGVVLDGPVYCYNYNRWLIRWSNGLQGWSAENWLRKVTQVTSPPDLTVTSVNFSPSSASIDQALTVNFTVANQGGSPSGSFSNRISLATSQWGTTYSLGNYSMGSLAAGASQSMTVTTNPVPSSVPCPGGYYVTVFTDSFQQIGESNENNNIGSSTPSMISVSCPAPQTGSINVSSNLSGVSFNLSGPNNYSGTAQWSTGNAPVGTYTITWSPMSGYTTPSQETRNLSQGGSISFYGDYQQTTPQTGSINVSSNLSGVSFNLSGPNNYSGTAQWSTGNAPVGTYTITWSPMSGYTTPSQETRTLVQGGMVSFDGHYQATRSLDKPPNVSSFSVSASEINQGQSVILSYRVTDDVGLKQVELWRADDTAGVDFREIDRTYISGKNCSGSFSDTPASSGIYRYGLHVVDSIGEWNCERNSRTGFSPGVYGPKEVVVKDATQSKCWSTDKLSNEELADLVIRHFPEGIVPQTSENIRVTAYAVARAESGGNSTACGDNDQSIGLWQIHMPSHPQYTEQYLFDPDNNAEAAKQVSNNGHDWNPWCTWEKSACGGNGNERYKGYLDEARAAIGVIERDTTPPTVTISYPSSGQSLTNLIATVTGMASDDMEVSKVEVRVGSGGWQKASGTESWSIQITLSPGSNIIYARVVDTSGNISGEASVTVNYRLSVGNNPKWIIVHHTGGTDQDPLASTKHHTFEVVNDWHRKLWPDFTSSLGYHIGYHYFVDATGEITQGRAETEEGAHTIGKNTESIGICLAGNFDRPGEMPTESQERNLVKLIRDVQKRWNIQDENIVPHRRFANKTCYGKNLPDDWVQGLFKKYEKEIQHEEMPLTETYQSIIDRLQQILDKMRNFFGFK